MLKCFYVYVALTVCSFLGYVTCYQLLSPEIPRYARVLALPLPLDSPLPQSRVSLPR